MRKDRIAILLLGVLLVLVGCSASNSLLDNPIDLDDIDQIQFVQAMGNPA